MQRGPSFIGRIRIGASVQQIRRELVVVASDRQQQCTAPRVGDPPAASASAGPAGPFKALIRVGSRIKQRASHIHSTVARRKQQRCPPLGSIAP